MFGEKLKLMTMQCCVCKTWTVLRVDPEDLERHKRGALVQRAFVNRDGKPYANHPPRPLVVWGLTPHKIHKCRLLQCN
jgi:hypothetical protein